MELVLKSSRTSISSLDVYSLESSSLHAFLSPGVLELEPLTLLLFFPLKMGETGSRLIQSVVVFLTSDSV